MIHNKLLERLSIEQGCPVGDALRAVVELHKPIKDEWIEYTTCKACRVAGDDYYSPVYPCFTIQAIEEELG